MHNSKQPGVSTPLLPVVVAVQNANAGEQSNRRATSCCQRFGQSLYTLAKYFCLVGGGVLGLQAMELQGWLGMISLHDMFNVGSWESQAGADLFLVVAAFANMLGKWALLYLITEGSQAFANIPDGIIALATRPGEVAREARANYPKYLLRAFIMLSSALLFSYINSLAIKPGVNSTIELAEKMALGSPQYSWLPSYLSRTEADGVKFRGVIATFMFNFVTGMGVANAVPVFIPLLWCHMSYQKGYQCFTNFAAGELTEYNDQKFNTYEHQGTTKFHLKNQGRNPDKDMAYSEVSTVTTGTKILAWGTCVIGVFYGGGMGWLNFLKLAKAGSEATAQYNNFGWQPLSSFANTINIGNSSISLIGVAGYSYMLILTLCFAFPPLLKAYQRAKRCDAQLWYKNFPVSIVMSALGFFAASAVLTQVELSGEQPALLFSGAALISVALLECPGFYSAIDIFWTKMADMVSSCHQSMQRRGVLCSM